MASDYDCIAKRDSEEHFRIWIQDTKEFGISQLGVNGSCQQARAFLRGLGWSIWLRLDERGGISLVCRVYCCSK